MRSLSRFLFFFFPLILVVLGIFYLFEFAQIYCNFLFNRYQTPLKKIFFFDVVPGNRNPHSNNHDNLYTSTRQDAFLRFHNWLLDEIITFFCIEKIRNPGESEKKHNLRRNPIEDGAISGFSGQKSVPE